MILPLPPLPYLQLALSLGGVDEWQFDSFNLEEASGGRPLSCLAFFLMKRMDLVEHFHLSETKLARWAGGSQAGMR